MSETDPSGQADVILRFRKEIAPSKLTYLGLQNIAFSDNDFYLLDMFNRAVVQVPFATIGKQDQIEILCRSSSAAIPMLRDLLRIKLLQKGYVTVHSSAFQFDDKGVMVCGWSKAGKTEAMLAFVDRGGSYIGDEWIAVAPGGEWMAGMPGKITLWKWHLTQISQDISPAVSLRKRIIFLAVPTIDKIHRKISKDRRARLPFKTFIDKIILLLRPMLNVREGHEQLMRNRPCLDRSGLDRIFFVMSWNKSEIKVESTDPWEISRRMIHSNEFERSQLIQNYRAFHFAFPDRSNDFIEGLRDLEAGMLSRAFQEKDAFIVRHPHPFSFSQLFEQMRRAI